MPEKQKELWSVDSVKFKDGVVSPDTASQLRQEFRAGKELRIEFDPVMRVIVLTHLRPGKTPEDPRIPNPDRPPVSSPLENVIWMR